MNFIYMWLTLGLILATFLDDQFSGNNFKRGRYIRLGVFIFGGLSFFDPLSGKGGNIGGYLASQSFQTGVSPF